MEDWSANELVGLPVHRKHLQTYGRYMFHVIGCICVCCNSAVFLNWER